MADEKTRRMTILKLGAVAKIVGKDERPGLSGISEDTMADSDGPVQVPMESAARKMTVEDQLTHGRLQALESIFSRATKSSGGALDTDQFREAVRHTMGSHITDQELDAMFMKVDTNCDGTVDWDEYLSYMLLEYKEKDAMNLMIQALPLPREIYKVPNMNRYQRHHDTVVRIRIQPNISKHANNLYNSSSDFTNGKYISVSKDGILNFWNMQLKNLRKHRLPPPKSHSKNIGLWVTDMACAPNLNMLVVSSTSGNIVFYDLTAYSFTPVLTLADLEICVTCMEFWVDPDNPSRAKLLWGDVRGSIACLAFDDCPSICFLQPTINKQFKARVEFFDLMKQTTCGVKAFKLPRVHQDLVLEIKYIHALNESFISCCRGKETSLCISDLRRKRMHYLEVDKGVQTFDYSVRHNMIITAGRDAVIRTWNPHFPHKPVMTLQGTKSPILFVFVHEEKEHIYSISQEKEIHVFDMNTQMCIQTLYRKWVPIGVRLISASIFNYSRQALVIANNNLAMFEHKEQDIRSLQYISHTKGVTHVLYNELFDQVVSGAVDSLIVVWDAECGHRLIQFQAHTIPQIGGGILELEITSMVFDPTQRRLITAARDGLIKLWNHNNGGLLRQIAIADTKDIAGIICLKERIMTAGWNRRITIYVDSYEDDSTLYWGKRHQEDITALTCKKPSTIASGSFDGDILLWMYETGHVTLRFNVHLSTKPITLVQDITELETDVSQSSTDTSASESETASEVPSSMDADEDDEMLKQFMAYNTHRASIAAPIPTLPSNLGGRPTEGNDLPKIRVGEERRSSTDRSMFGKPRRPSAAFGSTLETIHDVGALTLLRQSSPADLRASSSGNITGDMNRDRRGTRKMSTRNPLGSGFDLQKHLETIMNESNINEEDEDNVNNSNESTVDNRMSNIDNMSSDERNMNKTENIKEKNDTNNKKEIARCIDNLKKDNKGNCKSNSVINSECLSNSESCSNDINNNIDNNNNEHNNINNNNEARFRLNDILRRHKFQKNVNEMEIKTDPTGDARIRYDDYLMRNEASILKLIFLEGRESDSKTATLVSASSGGWIRFWVVEHTGGLIGQFNAAHHPGESVQAICVDKYCEYLFTGDTEGYIKVWDISDYCINPNKAPHHTAFTKQFKYAEFPLITQCDGKLKKNLVKQNRFRPPPLSSDPDNTWFAPELLNSFKGHMLGITGIDYVNISERIIACSTDCSVRMFTIYGQFIGIFGQDTPWTTQLNFEGGAAPGSRTQAEPRRRRRRGGNIQADLKITKAKVKRKVPDDIRSVASAATLRVLNNGIRPRWKLARNILLVFLPLLKKVREKRLAQHRKFSKPTILLPDTTIQKRRKSVAKQTATAHHSLNLEAVKKQLKSMEEKEYTSDILGMSYKPLMKHKPFPKLPKIRQFQSQCDVYSSLPFFQLAPIDNLFHPPEAILDVLVRQNLINQSFTSPRVRAGMRRWRRGQVKEKGVLNMKNTTGLKSVVTDAAKAEQKRAIKQFKSQTNEKDNGEDHYQKLLSSISVVEPDVSSVMSGYKSSSGAISSRKSITYSSSHSGNGSSHKSKGINKLPPITGDH